MEELIVAISMPRVVLDSATHLYRGPGPPGASGLREAPGSLGVPGSCGVPRYGRPGMAWYGWGEADGTGFLQVNG
jgi:hypothetical protein